MSVLSIIINYREAILDGLFVTLEMCLIIWVSGIVFGTLLGILGSRYKQEIGIPSKIASFFLAGIPVLVILFWFHFPLQQMLGIVVDPFFTATFVISVINIFAVADLIRGIMDNFPEQYVIAAKVCGMQENEIVKHIQFPIIFREALPGLLNIQVNMLQLTLFASLISVGEIFRVAQRINSLIYSPVEIYSALAIFFLAICLPLNGLALYLKKRFTRNLSDK